MNADELRRQQLAMRSFTESVEMDAPPPAVDTATASTASAWGALPAAAGLSSNALYDHEWWRGDAAEDGEPNEVNEMRSSSTVDTIIEVVRSNASLDDESPIAREAMGETQKYVMSVPGPGHVDQELELHASLLRHADDEPQIPVSAVGVSNSVHEETDEDDEEFALDAELRRVTAMAEAAERALRDRFKSTDVVEDEDIDRRRIREAYNRAAAARPRPTTPTSGCATDDDGFLARYASAGQEAATTDRRIHVSIPNHSASTSQHEKRRATFSAVDSNVTPRWKTDTAIDLLETNPEYARNAPRPPVVHRRASVDWERFADGATKPTSAWVAVPSASTTISADDAAAFGDDPTATPAGSYYQAQHTYEASKNDFSFGNDDSEWAAKPDRTMDDRQDTVTTAAETATPPSSPIAASTVEGIGRQKNNNDKNFVADVTRRLSVAAPTDSGPVNAVIEFAPAAAVASEDATISAASVIAPVRAAPPPPPGKPTAEQQHEYEQPTGYGIDVYGSERTPYDHAGYNVYSYDSYGNALATQSEKTTEQPQYGGYNTYNEDYGGYVGYETSTYGGYDSNDASDQIQAAYSSETDIPTGAYSYGGYGGYGNDATGYAGYGTDYGTSGYGTEVTTAYDTYNTTGYGTENNTAVYDTSVYSVPVSETAYGSYDPYAGYSTPADSYSTTETRCDNTSSALQYDDTSQQQYGDVTVTASLYGHEPNSAEPTAIEQPPPAPLLAPFLPPQRARTPDPFSWEAQANAYAKYGTAVAPPRPPPIAPFPTPSATTPGTAPTLELVDSQTPTVEELVGKADSEGSKSPPPPARSKPQAPARPPAPPHARPADPPTAAVSAPAAQEEDEDPWERFKKMSEQASNAVKSTAEQLKTLSETTAVKEIKDESYLAQVGGSQGFELNAAQRQILQMQEEKKKAKAEKKRQKAAGKRSPSPTFDPKREEDLERQAAELVKKMAANRADLADWKPPSDQSSATGIIGPEVKAEAKKEFEDEKSTEKQETKPKSGHDVQNTPPAAESFADFDSEAARAVVEPPSHPDWADFSADRPAALPTSDSDFFARAEELAASRTAAVAIDEPAPVKDPFAPNLIEDTYDPFDIRPAEEIIEAAKQRMATAESELEVSAGVVGAGGLLGSHRSTPTPEGGSPASSRPTGFDDDFRVERSEYSHTPTPLYDEDDTLPLADFALAADASAAEEGWSLMLRHPLKKKIMADRFWKPCHVRIRDNTVLIFNERTDAKPVQEILLQSSYLLSETTLQAYDEFGKIHTIKLQHVLYKERVGIRPGQISRLVEGHVTKYGLPLEHAAQTTVLAKFGSLDENVLTSFVRRVEDVLFHCPATNRQTAPVYKQDEVQIHCYDEYRAHIDRDGQVGEQRARVRFFCLAFLSGAPFVEVGLNDRRREGKEIVRRKDILPMYTERWIRFEAVEFHAVVDRPLYDQDQVIRFQPPDGCFFEVMRFRVRPPKNREKSLTVKAVMKIAGSKVEINIKAMAAAQTQRARGTLESTRTIPCEDIQIRFPIPESWIYIFREERHWGVGSVHSKTRRTGKVKNLRDRLMGTVQHTEPTLIEVAIGEAKYEHLFRSLVWRIPRLPEKHHDAYKTHLLKCRFELSSFDLMPDEFKSTCEIDFTMPLATVSNTVVRSVAIEQHEDSDRVEKFVRYVAKCQYKLDIDYVHCNDLDEELANVAKIPELAANQPATARHISAFDPNEVEARHAGYGVEELPALADVWAAEQNGGNMADIELQGYGGDGCVSDSTATVNGAGRPAIRRPSGGGFGAFAAGGEASSSSDDEDAKARKVPMVEINMQGYGY